MLIKIEIPGPTRFDGKIPGCQKRAHECLRNIDGHMGADVLPLTERPLPCSHNTRPQWKFIYSLHAKYFMLMIHLVIFHFYFY